MVTISDVSIIDSNTAEASRAEHGWARTICSEGLCGAKTLTAYRRTVLAGRVFEPVSGADYHLVYVMAAPHGGRIGFGGDPHEAEPGAGVLLAPGENASFEARGSDMELLHLVALKPPAAVEAGLPGGPGYFFNRGTLRPLSDASGGRVRRFCAESSVRLADGARLTPTNAIQAGEMHYREGGSSPYHAHVGTDANKDGADHCYMIFKGHGRVEVGETGQALEAGTLVYFPPGVPHRLRAVDGPLDYFEIQVWRSFRTEVYSEDPLGLKWYYEPDAPGATPAEWNQS